VNIIVIIYVADFAQFQIYAAKEQVNCQNLLKFMSAHYVAITFSL